MRTAKILKYLAYGALLGGLFISLKFFTPGQVRFWLVVFLSITSWCVLRVFANIAQIVYELRAELVRAVGNIERANYRTNSLLKEVSGLLELHGEAK